MEMSECRVSTVRLCYDCNLPFHPQLKSVKTGSVFWSTLASLSYFYMVSVCPCCVRTQVHKDCMLASTFGRVSHKKKLQQGARGPDDSLLYLLYYILMFFMKE